MLSEDPPLSSGKPTIIFLTNSDSFFMAHFQHLARRTVGCGGRAVLASNISASSAILAGSGIERFNLPAQRAGVRPLGIGPAVHALEQVLRQIDKPILHAFGLFGILVGTLATRRMRNVRCIFTVTGRGYAAVAGALDMRALAWGTALFNRFVADSANTHWMVENAADIFSSGLSSVFRANRVLIVGGAGVDPDVFKPTPMPPMPPLRLGFVGRLIWSKGLDIAVRAVTLARSRGCNVTLAVAGSPDRYNPRIYSESEMRAFAATPGVQFLGEISQVADFWREHHVMLLPSRGGEGLPKSLLEAASCGRPMLVSRVPGCEDLARATDGWLFPAGDVEAAANAIVEIANCREIETRGAFARSVIQAKYSEEKLWEAVKPLYFG